MTFSWDFFNPDTQEWEVIQSSADRGYARQDANFNATAITDQSGTVLERYVYDPYGRSDVLTASWTFKTGTAAFQGNYAFTQRFQGLRLDLITTNHNARNRDLNSRLSVWNTPDPAGYVDGGNRYQFERSDPVGSLDPLGLQTRAGDDPIRLSPEDKNPFESLQFGGIPPYTPMTDHLANLNSGLFTTGTHGVRYDPNAPSFEPGLGVDVDLFVGIDVDLVGAIGFEGCVGLVLDLGNLGDSGVFISLGPAGGANVGVGVGGGIVLGEIEGQAVGFDVNAFGGSFAPFMGKDGSIGLAVYAGPGIGLSASSTTTNTCSVAELFDSLK